MRTSPAIRPNKRRRFAGLQPLSAGRCNGCGATSDNFCPALAYSRQDGALPSWERLGGHRTLSCSYLAYSVQVAKRMYEIVQTFIPSSQLGLNSALLLSSRFERPKKIWCIVMYPSFRRARAWLTLLALWARSFHLTGQCYHPPSGCGAAVIWLRKPLRSPRVNSPGRGSRICASLQNG